MFCSGELLCIILEVYLIDTFSGVTIGFNQRTYSVIEGARHVSVTVSVLNGTLARSIRVGMYPSSATASSRSGKSWLNLFLKT